MNASERAIVALAREQHGTIARRQALHQGMSRRAIERRVGSGQWVALFRGAYLLGGTEPTWEQRIMAGCLAAGDGAVASHRAAAALHGMPGAPRWVEVTVVRPRHVELTGITAHRTTVLEAEDVGELNGIPLTLAVRTVIDLAAIYTPERLGPMLDHALAQRLLTRTDLETRASGLVLGRRHAATTRNTAGCPAGHRPAHGK